jgi:hypothetical protein
LLWLSGNLRISEPLFITGRSFQTAWYNDKKNGEPLDEIGEQVPARYTLHAKR